MKAKDLYRKRLLVPSKNPCDPNYRRLRYVRYADDFIVGFVGGRDELVHIQRQVEGYLNAYLRLDPKFSDSSIKRASKERVRFLGVDVSVPMYKESAFSTVVRTRNGMEQKFSSKRRQGVVKLKVDIKSIIKRLNSAGFCDKLGKPTPRFQLYGMRHGDIINNYNRVKRGFLNYFRFVDNYSRLGFTLQYILIRSCCKLLAAKFKLKTQNAVYKKFGKNLNHQDGVCFE